MSGGSRIVKAAEGTVNPWVWLFQEMSDLCPMAAKERAATWSSCSFLQVCLSQPRQAPQQFEVKLQNLFYFPSSNRMRKLHSLRSDKRKELHLLFNRQENNPPLPRGLFPAWSLLFLEAASPLTLLAANRPSADFHNLCPSALLSRAQDTKVFRTAHQHLSWM